MPRTDAEPRPKPRTRERILDAALDAFAEHGFEGTTIAEIERRVGLASGTGSFYRHFASKDALLRAAVDLEVERCMADAARERAALPVFDDERAAFAANAEQILRDMRRFDRLMRLMMNEGDRVPEVRDAIGTALRGSGAVDWTGDRMLMVGITALMGYHVSSRVGGGMLDGVSQEEFIAALAALADGTGRFRFGKS
jgi:AcrR family transcriptional regulator